MDPTDRAIKGFYCMYSGKSGSSAASPARPVWQYLSSPEGWRVITRRSENDNTPQPLDQWMNSSFMGQQVGNCKCSHWLITWLIYLPCLSSIPPCIQHHIQLTSPSLSESTLPFLRYSDFNILAWKSKVKVMGEVKVESYNMGPTFYWLTSLRSMSIGHPNSEKRLFQNLTLKIQGQGHGWGQCWKSRSGCNILSTHIPFVPCQSTLPFLRYKILKIFRPIRSLVHSRTCAALAGFRPGSSLDSRRVTSSKRPLLWRWVGSWPLLLHALHEDTGY